MNLNWCGADAVRFQQRCVRYAALPNAAQGAYRQDVTIVVGTDARRGYRQLWPGSPGNPKASTRKPNVIVQNMPGAGSMKDTEYLYGIDQGRHGHRHVLPRADRTAYRPAGKVRYDPDQVTWYLRTRTGATWLCITSAKSKIKTFEDAQTIPSTMGGVSAGSSTVDYVNMFNALAGTKFKLVSGYKSTAEIVLAIDRGEADGVCGYDTGSLRAQRPEWYAHRSPI
jgi:hypothetical protein